MRIGAAPVSWGICEVPGWGYQLPGPTVLREIAAVGLTSTELGPPGFLPEDGTELAAELAAHGLAAIGAFAPLVLHVPGRDPVAELRPYLERLRACSGEVVVVAAASDGEGYDTRPELDDAQWALLLDNLALVAEAAAAEGLTAVLHPHMGTVVEQWAEVQRVLQHSSMPLCLDTGHLLIGGGDPLELSREHGDRVAYVQLKDVDASLAARVRSGELRYSDAVSRGMYTPLGQGDIDVRGVVGALASHGYDGWLVLEQDRVLQEAPAGDELVADARASVGFLRSVLAEVAADAARAGG